MAVATMRIKGTDVVTCKLDTASGTATELKDLLDSVTVTKVRASQPDTRIGDAATRVRPLKPTWSVTLSLHPDTRLHPVFEGTDAEEITARTFTLEVGDGQTGTNGYKIEGEVFIIESPMLVVQGDGDTPPVTATLEPADGEGFTFTTTTSA